MSGEKLTPGDTCSLGLEYSCPCLPSTIDRAALKIVSHLAVFQERGHYIHMPRKKILEMKY